MTETKIKKPRVKQIKKIVAPVESKLSLLDIKNENEKYNELVKVEFDNGKYTEIKVKFKPTDIEKMLEDFADFLNEYQKLGNVIRDKDVLDYLSLHIVLHFSSIVGDMPSDIHEKVDLFQQLLNSEYGEVIMESFDKNEIVKVHTYMRKKLDQYMEMAKMDANLKQQLRDKIGEMNLENKDILLSTFFKEDESNA